MRRIDFKPLTVEGFAKYGTFANMINPDTPKIGAAPIEFYRDMVQSTLGNKTSPSFSVCRVTKREPVVNVSEFHNHCGEIVMPIDGDIVMHLGPATPDAEVPVDDIEIFHVPKGTLCCLKPGTWHHAPYAYKSECVNCLIVLPERTYATDCTVVEIPPEKHLYINNVE